METTASLPYSVRPCTPQDRSAILALLKVTVGETESSRKTEEFWRWKHERSPFGVSYSVCAYDEARDLLAGLRTMMSWEFSDPAGLRCRAARPVDTATHPEYQRRGIFSALTRFSVEELAAAGVAMIFNTPNENSLPGYLKMGWQVVSRWPLYARLARPLAAPGEILRARAGTELTRAGDPALTGWREFSAEYSPTIAEIVERNETGRRQVGYRTIRTREYLDWRYGGHPDVRYEVYPQIVGSRLEGFIIGRRATSRGNLDSFAITELFLRNPSTSSASRLLKEALARIPYLYAVAHFSDGTVERGALRRTGFLRMPRRGYTFVARSLNALPRDPAGSGAWDLTLGELEIF